MLPVLLTFAVLAAVGLAGVKFLWWDWRQMRKQMRHQALHAIIVDPDASREDRRAAGDELFFS